MTIIYEDENLVVVNKPAGMLVHAGAGETGPTLVDFILDKYPEMKKYSWPDPSRSGIVHRLDKDTSGLIVIAKNPKTQKFLQDQFKNRKINKRYLALVLGQPNVHLRGVHGEWKRIVADIGRDQKNRLKQKVTPMVFSWTKGKTRFAETHYRVIKYFHTLEYGSEQIFSLLEVKPITGRMHQIRVHLKYLGYPIIGDPIYNTKESRRISKKLGLNHQFLHAYRLKFQLPEGQIKEFRSDLPKDLQEVLKKIK